MDVFKAIMDKEFNKIIIIICVVAIFIIIRWMFKLFKSSQDE